MHCDIAGKRITVNIVGIGLRRHPDFSCVEMVFSCLCLESGDFTFRAAVADHHLDQVFRTYATPAA